ncbi:MAG: hypothetical protein AAFR16_08710 [Pseudomonadota bacterium]
MLDDHNALGAHRAIKRNERQMIAVRAARKRHDLEGPVDRPSLVTSAADR